MTKPVSPPPARRPAWTGPAPALALLVEPAVSRYVWAAEILLPGFLAVGVVEVLLTSRAERKYLSDFKLQRCSNSEGKGREIPPLRLRRPAPVGMTTGPRLRRRALLAV